MFTIMSEDDCQAWDTAAADSEKPIDRKGPDVSATMTSDAKAKAVPKSKTVSSKIICLNQQTQAFHTPTHSSFERGSARTAKVVWTINKHMSKCASLLQ